MSEHAPKDTHKTAKPTRVEDIKIDEISSYRLSRHNQAIRVGRDAEALRLGVSIDEWRILFVLHQQGPQPSIRLAEGALMDRGTVSRSVARMEKRGLVFRLADANDGRVAIVNLTEDGGVIAEQINAFMLHREMDLIGTLTDEEWHAWLTITDKFYKVLKDKYQNES